MRSCQKMRFTSRADARKFVRSRGNIKHARMRPYKCDRCGQWHLTSLTAVEQRARGLRGSLGESPPDLPKVMPLRAKPAPRQPWEPRPARSRAA